MISGYNEAERRVVAHPTPLITHRLQRTARHMPTNNPTPCSQCGLLPSRSLAVKNPATCRKCYSRNWEDRNRPPKPIDVEKQPWKARNRERTRIVNNAWQRANAGKRLSQHLAWIRKHHDYRLWRSAHRRAATQGIVFTITRQDVRVDKHCPICQREMVARQGKNGRQSGLSHTLDRLIPALGYVPGNVWVICHFCNSTKNNATPDFMIDVLAEVARRGLLSVETRARLLALCVGP